MNQVNVALIGCGGMMGAHAEGYRQLWSKGIKNFRIIAACDVDTGKADTMAKKIEEWQGTLPAVYGDYRELLSTESSVDAVDLSLVHRIHHSVAIPCIEAGKHITIEKPIGMTMRAGKAIMDAAEKKGTVLQVAENYRRSPEERAVNWAIKQGRIGKLRMLYWIDVSERLWHWGWRDEVDQAGGGWSMDGGVHFADLFRYHIGEVDEIYAVSKAYCPMRYQNHEVMEGPIPATVEDTTVAVVKFRNGVTGQWTSTNAAPGSNFSARVIYGDDGSIRWGEGLTTRSEKISMGDLVQEFIGSISAEEKERLFPRGITDTVATELNEFIEAVANGSPVEITGLEGYKDEALSMALYESSELNAPVKVEKIENLEIENYQNRFNKMLGLV